jgi:hypothetical protein
VTVFKSLKRVLRSCNLRYTNFSRKNPVKTLRITLNLRCEAKRENTKQDFLQTWQYTWKSTFQGERLEPIVQTRLKTAI